MIAITGTAKIKGILDLSGINLQMKKNDTISLSDEQFYDRSVQAAVRMGFLTFERSDSFSADSAQNLINCRNIYDRTLRINAINSEIRPGQVFTLSQNQINSSDIRGALAKGLIEIVSAVQPVDEQGEETVKVGNLFEEPTIASEAHLETNEELFDPAIIQTENPTPVQKRDIPDPKGKTVIWNPNHEPLAHTKTSMKAVGVDKQGETTALETNVEIGDIKFVDQNLDAERRKSHPILKNKQVEQAGEIDFI